MWFLLLSIEKQMLFLLSRADKMDTQELVALYEKQGYSSASIRNALSHLKKEGYVVSPARSQYEITSSGRSFIRSINLKPQLYGQAWDGSWQAVMVEIPESERKKRDRFRADILQVGFGLLHNGVYIAPWDYTAEIEHLVDKHDIGAYVTVFEGRITNRSIAPEEASAIWSLDAVQRHYEQQRAWFEEEFAPQAKQVFASGCDPMACFLLYLTLGQAISELYLLDPMLPEALLPAGWIGQKTLQFLLDEMSRIASAIPAESRYADFVASADRQA